MMIFALAERTLIVQMPEFSKFWKNLSPWTFSAFRRCSLLIKNSTLAIPNRHIFHKKKAATLKVQNDGYVCSLVKKDKLNEHILFTFYFLKEPQTDCMNIHHRYQNFVFHDDSDDFCYFDELFHQIFHFLQKNLHLFFGLL